MKLCYLREGVNHLTNCREAVDTYWEAMKALKGGFQLADSTRWADSHQKQEKQVKR